MILKIDTSENNYIKLLLRKGNNVLDKRNKKVEYKQSEQLLAEIDKFLKKNNLLVDNLSAVQVENVAKKDTGFTSLRAGVITANALAYALGVDVLDSDGAPHKTVRAFYNAEPNIT